MFQLITTSSFNTRDSLNAKLFTLFLILGNLAELSVASTPEPLHQNSGRHLVELINFHRFQADLGKLNWDMDEHTYTAREELDSNQVVDGDKIEHLACDRYDYTRKKFRESWETKKDKDISAFVFYTEDGNDPKAINLTKAVKSWYSGRDRFKFDIYRSMGCFSEDEEELWWDSINFMQMMYSEINKMGCAILNCPSEERNVLYCVFDKKVSEDKPVFDSYNFLELCKNDTDTKWEACDEDLNEECHKVELPTTTSLTTTKPKKTTTKKPKPKTTTTTKKPKPTTKGIQIRKALTTVPGGLQVEGRNLSEEARRSFAENSNAVPGTIICFAILIAQSFY